MTIKHLKIFVEVCRLESFTLAAETLNSQQPAISLAIKEMETYYSVKLFDRMNRKIYLTESGKILYDYATSILAQFYEAENVLRNTNKLYRIRVGCVDPFVPNSLVTTLKNFSAKYPQIGYNAVITNSAHIENLLLKNELDLGIIEHSFFSSSFHTKLLYEENLLVVCGREYYDTPPQSLSLAMLSKEKLLLREHGTGQRNTIDSVFHAQGYHIHPILESCHVSSLIEAAVCNMGILILSPRLIPNELEQGILQTITISDATFCKKYHVAYHKHKQLSDSLKLFITEIENSLLD